MEQNEEDSSDLWDDTALIQAYDNAISSMKNKLGVGESTEVHGGAAANVTPAAKNKKKHKKNKRKKEQQARHSTWRVGSRCRAIYSEDGQLYDAVIRSVDPQRGRCLVVYNDYGNEEQQLLCDLLHPSSVGATSQRQRRNNSSMSDNTSDIVSEVDGVESSASTCSGSVMPPPHSQQHRSSAANHSDNHSARHSARHKSNHCAAGFKQSQSGFTSFPFTAPPPLFTGPQGWMGAPSRHTVHNTGVPPCIPDIPPPPMPDDEGAVSDREALYSMLISWYMSGYHTGYYQGVKQQQQRQATTTTDADSDDSTTASLSTPHKDR